MPIQDFCKGVEHSGVAAIRTIWASKLGGWEGLPPPPPRSAPADFIYVKSTSSCRRGNFVVPLEFPIHLDASRSTEFFLVGWGGGCSVISLSVKTGLYSLHDGV